MTTQIQRRRGTTAQHSTFTGAVGEVTVDTDKEVLVVHDGAQVGGYPQMRENGSNSALALGSAGTPSLKFAGDTNTGIYSPGADQVAISTNGTGRLFVNNLGDIETVGSSNWNFAGLAIRRTSSNTADSKVISFLLDGDTRNNTNLYSNVNFVLRTDSAPTTGSTSSGLNAGLEITSPATIRFGTNGSERLRITSAGLVGIGTSAPGQQLSITTASNDDGIVLTNSSANGGRVRLNSTGTGGRAYHIISTADGSGLAGGKFVITDNTASDAARFVIDSSGRVGIGTTSASERFHVVGGNSRFDGNYVSFNNNGYIRTDATNELRLQMGSSGTVFSNSGNTEIARFDTSGRLLVGTSSSVNTAALGNAQVQLVGTTNETSQFAISRFSNDADRGRLVFIKSRGSSGTNTIVQADDAVGRIEFLAADGSGSTAYPVAAHIGVFVDGTPGANDMPGRLVFSTTADGASSPTEAMRIDSTQNLLIGGLDTGGKVTITRSGTVLRLNTASTSNTAVQFVYNGSTQVGTITTTTTATAYNTSSDYRLKENVAPVTDGITRLQQLKPSRFNFIADPAKTVDGFLAHEVQTVVPEAITGEKDAVDDEGNPVYQGIDQSKMVPLLTAALQEAVAKIESLEARLTAAGL